jgi:hypothetical protein
MSSLMHFAVVGVYGQGRTLYSMTSAEIHRLFDPSGADFRNFEYRQKRLQSRNRQDLAI